MHITYGLNNYCVRYLKRFLANELKDNTNILGEFDKKDQQNLIKYLNLPNVKSMFDVQKEIREIFPELEAYFNIELKDNEIVFTSKSLSKTTSEYIHNNKTKIIQYCKSVGWNVTKHNEWLDWNYDVLQDGVIDNKDLEVIYNIANKLKTYPEEIISRADINLDGQINDKDIQRISNYINNTRLSISIKKEDRMNYFPNKDMLVFINQFTHNFLFNYAIKDNLGIDSIPHKNNSGMFKIALYKCKSSQQITIAHNSKKVEHLVIGSSKANIKSNIPNIFLDNVTEIDLAPGECYQYMTDDKSNYVCIQCNTNYNDMHSAIKKEEIIQLGDVNLDGKIDMEDYILLANYTAVGDNAEKYHWEATPKQLIAMDIAGETANTPGPNGKITIEDAKRLKMFLDGNPSITSLGTRKFIYDDYTNKENLAPSGITDLLIIDGHYDKSINVPYKEFTNTPWIVHEKFLNYLLDMSITKYTDSEDITYLQKLLNETIVDTKEDIFYPGNYTDRMNTIIKNYQLSHVNYYLGDLNNDNKIDSSDLTMLRQIIEHLNCQLDESLPTVDGYRKITQSDFDILNNYLQGTQQLTTTQLFKADINFDGKIDKNDLKIIQEHLENKRPDFNKNGIWSNLKKKADINGDKQIDKQDYELLEKEVTGETNNLKNYLLSFMLGWLDVETEALLENEYNQQEKDLRF